MDSLLQDIRNLSIKSVDDEDYLFMNSKYVPLKIDSINVNIVVATTSNIISKKILFYDIAWNS